MIECQLAPDGAYVPADTLPCPPPDVDLESVIKALDYADAEIARYRATLREVRRFSDCWRKVEDLARLALEDGQ
jgi:hypothetical protein